MPLVLSVYLVDSFGAVVLNDARYLTSPFVLVNSTFGTYDAIDHVLTPEDVLFVRAYAIEGELARASPIVTMTSCEVLTLLPSALFTLSLPFTVLITYSNF